MTNARLEELRTRFQENPRRYFAPFANELRKSGDAAQAIAICRAHLAGQPGHVSGHIVLGQALYEAGEGDEARGIFTAALELDPENLIALRTLGEIAQVKGEFAAARLWYERLLDADPRNSDVVQLLKDIPAESVSTAETSLIPPAVAVEEAQKEPLPAAPSIPEAPRFHTNYTGVARAYEPREPEPAAAPQAALEDLLEMPASEADAEPEVVVAESQPVAADTFETVDLDSFPGDVSATAVEASAPMEAPSLEAEAPVVETVTSFESFHPDEVEAPPMVEALPDLEVFQSVAESESAPAAEPEVPDSYEPRKAVFAEHGFEGPVDDEVGWVAPPSAAYSDLEAAPEDWFAEPAPPAAEDLVEATVEATDWIEPVQPAPPEDSWFDEVAGVSEPVMEAGNDDAWLPDFAGVGGHDAPAEPDNAAAAMESLETAPDARADGSLEPAQVEVPAAELEAPVPVSEEAELPVGSHGFEPSFEPQSLSESAEEAVFVEHHPEVTAEATEPPIEAADEFAPGVEFEAVPAVMHDEEVAPAAGELIETNTMEFATSKAGHLDEFPDAAPAAEHQGAPVEEEPAGAVAELEGVELEAEPVAARAEFPDPAIGRTPSFTSAIPQSTPAPAPFVTETLAELYLQQGFRDEALAIYRQLLERSPADQSLKVRIEAIERGAASDVVQAADAADATRAPSESVRSFFGRLARRAPVDGGQAPPSTVVAPAAEEPPFATAASALANLFAASKPQAADERAASALSGAFTDPTGRPSRAAERELSLDHLFREVPPGGSPGAGVTLDEFYASETAQPAAAQQAGEAAPDEGATDIRQFTAWLEGLRKK